MVPSSRMMTSGDPFFAHANAQCLLMGLARPFVNAHAESMTHPEIVIVVPISATATKDTAIKTRAGRNILREIVTIFPPQSNSAVHSVRRLPGTNFASSPLIYALTSKLHIHQKLEIYSLRVFRCNVAGMERNAPAIIAGVVSINNSTIMTASREISAVRELGITMRTHTPIISGTQIQASRPSVCPAVLHSLKSRFLTTGARQGAGNRCGNTQLDQQGNQDEFGVNHDFNLLRPASQSIDSRFRIAKSL